MPFSCRQPYPLPQLPLRRQLTAARDSAKAHRGRLQPPPSSPGQEQQQLHDAPSRRTRLHFSFLSPAVLSHSCLERSGACGIASGSRAQAFWVQILAQTLTRELRDPFFSVPSFTHPRNGGSCS